ncbi:hypothetical protein HDU67_010409 [Dinochytrium kinnereticum]|nr:hypothetical protein HDU67_010409 [Dinochytrium kinnereticum]
MISRVANPSMAIARRFASSGAKSAWGPISFEGVNWVKNGALPFGFRNRFVWYTSFAVVTTTFFLVPFINTEMKIAPLRAAERAKKAAE